MRDVLTGIYQRHCAQPDESVDAGLARFSASRSLAARTALANVFLPFFFLLACRTGAREGLFHDRCAFRVYFSAMRGWLTYLPAHGNSAGSARVWAHRQRAGKAAQFSRARRRRIFRQQLRVVARARVRSVATQLRVSAPKYEIDLISVDSELNYIHAPHRPRPIAVSLYRRIGQLACVLTCRASWVEPNAHTLYRKHTDCPATRHTTQRE